jgi:putative hydrolase of the HAD superfamily
MKTLIERIKDLSRPLEPIPTGAKLRLQPLDGIETVLFDIYGTLLVSGCGDISIASEISSAEALTQALIVSGYAGAHERAGELGPALLNAELVQWHDTAKKNGNPFPEVEVSRIWKNVITRFQSMELLKPDDDPQRILRLIIEYECRINPVWPMPAAQKTIENLKARGFRLGIVSNAQFYTPLIMAALFGRPPGALGFEKELCVYSYKQLRAKPSVELFQTLENRVEWSKTLYVGNDMLNDIWTASQLGCRTCLFAGDNRSLRLRENDKRCKKLVPDAVVDHLHQITEIV